MAYENLGLSFMPPGQGTDTAGPNGMRLEDILRVLSFRLPRFLGAHPVAPAAISGGAGGGTSQRDPIADAITGSVLQKLLQGAPMQSPPGTTNPVSSILAPLTGGSPVTQPPPKAPAPSIDYGTSGYTGIPNPQPVQTQEPAPITMPSVAGGKTKIYGY